MKNRPCDTYQELLDRKWDGEGLSAGEQEALSSHLEGCFECAALSADMEALLAGAEGLRDLQYEREVTIAPMVLNARPRPMLPWALGVAAVAASVAIGVFLGGSVARVQSPSPTVVRLAVPVPQASSVAVVGDFTGWREQIPLQVSQDGMWVGELQLLPGRYQYLIVVDGEQMQVDPAARQVVDDGFGGKNSVLDVGI